MTRVLCVLGVLAFACGDDDGGMDAGRDAFPTDDGVPDVPLVDTSAPMAITIRAVGGPEGSAPFEGLRVFVGTTMVATTDAAGEAQVMVTPGAPVTVEYVGSMTTYTSLVAYDDAVPRDGDVYIVPMLQQRDDLDLVTITGTITNALAETTVYVLGADAPSAVSSLGGGDPNPDFEVTLPRREGTVALHMGVVVPTEDPLPSPRGFHRTIGDVGAIKQVDASMNQTDVVVDADPGADGVTLVSLSGSFSVPSGDEFFDVASGNVVQRTVRGTASALGGVSRIYFDEATSAFQWEAMQVPGEAGVTEFFLSQGPRFSLVSLDGSAVGDQGEIPFFPPPNITSPGFDETVSPGGRVVLESVPSDAYVSLFLINGEDALWWVLSGNASEIVIPELPAGATVLVGDDVRFRPRFCNATTEGDPFCRRISFGPAAGAAP